MRWFKQRRQRRLEALAAEIARLLQPRLVVHQEGRAINAKISAAQKQQLDELVRELTRSSSRMRFNLDGKRIGGIN